MKQLFTFSRSGRPRSGPAWLPKLLLPALLLGQCYQAQAQTQTFPRVESFQNSAAGGFTLGGTAKLTAAPGADGTGYLQLTSAGTNQSGFAIDQSSFPAPNGFNISFEFFAYGGSGADGFSVFLVDADQTAAAVAAGTFKPGASGGSLGYAQKAIAPISDGVPFGYIGIGIDEFGNYANPTEGRVGGIGFISDAVSIRGAGNGQKNTDYPYLTGSPTLPFSLDVPTVRAQAGTADYRRAYIDVVPVLINGVTSYRITVRIQHGAAVTTVVSDYLVSAPPKNLRIGFSGSTGGSTNFHEIRKLAVREAPALKDDVASTPYNQAVSVNVLANDVFPYADYKSGSLDLDPNTAGVQSELTVAGQGTFTATPEGIVTFTPLGTFSGVVTIPYTASDVQGSFSTPENPKVDETGSPANITVTVRGADLTTSVNGPTTADPGTDITYTVNTRNLSTAQSSEPALNVVPYIDLPPNLTNVRLSSGSYNAATGRVTFGTTASLAAGAAAIVNTVTFKAPASGSVTGAATFTHPPGTPDPVTTNDAATISTYISGVLNPAEVCATPGKDGPISLAAGAIPNTYYAGTASVAKGAKSISVGTAVGSITPIAAGDLLLVMQMQGAEINTSNNSSYGSNTASGAGYLGNANYTAGTYEYVTAAGPVAGGSVPLTAGLANAYSNDALTGGIGQRRFQVVRVPQYSALTVTGAVTGMDWTGRSGGILALDVAGTTTFSEGSLTMTGKGFRGGGGKKYTGTGTTSYASTDYVRPTPATAVGAHAPKGEGLLGTPLFINNNGAPVSNPNGSYPVGSVGRGAPGNAGGGGSDGNPITTATSPAAPNGNNRNTGGGGGANGGTGGTGGAFNAGQTTVSATGGIGGAAVGSASTSRLVLGGGGGAGTNNNGGTTDNAYTSSGSDGGGIIIFRTGLVSGDGSIQANGDNSLSATDDGGGGGGAGGTVLVAVQSTGIANLTVQAIGGAGGNATSSDTTQFGSGGGGGGGRVYANGALNAASTVAAGANGMSAASGGTLADNGATAGRAGVITNGAIPAALPSVGGCLPTFNVGLSTPAHTVARGAGNAVGPISYTLSLSNTGGSASNVSAVVSLEPSLFAYDPSFTPVATLRLADGSSSAFTITPPPAASSAPTFGAFLIPAGATLLITFQATVASTVTNNVIYQASSTVTYTDPTRTATTATTGPSLNYATGAPAPGTNYVGTDAQNTGEDVTIVAPLPVALTRFTAVALRSDAHLRWTTASEHNNDRFVVERSLDGASFEAVGTVRGQGNSDQATDYELLDAGAARRTAAGQPIYYRLRQVDTDGVSAYSAVRSVVFGTKGTISVYPNPTPTGTAATLDLSGLAAGSYLVEVLDLTGRRVAAYSSLAGATRHQLDVKALVAGTYVVRVRGGALSQSLLLTKE